MLEINERCIRHNRLDQWTKCMLNLPIWTCILLSITVKSIWIIDWIYNNFISMSRYVVAKFVSGKGVLFVICLLFSDVSLLTILFFVFLIIFNNYSLVLVIICYSVSLFPVSMSTTWWIQLKNAHKTIYSLLQIAVGMGLLYWPICSIAKNVTVEHSVGFLVWQYLNWLERYTCNGRKRPSSLIMLPQQGWSNESKNKLRACNSVPPPKLYLLLAALLFITCHLPVLKTYCRSWIVDCSI